MYVGFVDLGKAFIGLIKREALWQVLGMCDVGGKLLNEITSMSIV